MAKRVKTIVKLQLPAGKATPAPPVGTGLGPHAVNIMQFVKEYNERTANQAGSIVPVEITIFEDRTFSFITKTPPAADLLKKALGIELDLTKASMGMRCGRGVFVIDDGVVTSVDMEAAGKFEVSNGQSCLLKLRP